MNFDLWSPLVFETSRQFQRPELKRVKSCKMGDVSESQQWEIYTNLHQGDVNYVRFTELGLNGKKIVDIYGVRIFDPSIFCVILSCCRLLQVFPCLNVADLQVTSFVSRSPWWILPWSSCVSQLD